VIDPGLLHLSLIVFVPLLLAATGELVMERTGLLNVAVEGMMALGAAAGFLAAFKLGGSWDGYAAGAISGAALALLLAVFAVWLRSDQITTGLVLLVGSTALASILYRVAVGVSLQAPIVAVAAPAPVPVLSRLPVLGGILFDQSWVVYGSLLMVPALWLFLFRTRAGLAVRACGDAPRAADSLGIPVAAIRYGAAAVGGGLIGLAGAYLPLAITGGYQDGIVGGRGWIALMLVIFGRWRPGLVALGCLLFAYVEALQFKLAVTLKALPPQVLLSLPYVLAILALISVYRGAHGPAGLGRPFDREQRA
jgi:ABC-type uncharacterized transport system permease subunit